MIYKQTTTLTYINATQIEKENTFAKLWLYGARLQASVAVVVNKFQIGMDHGEFFFFFFNNSAGICMI